MLKKWLPNPSIRFSYIFFESLLNWFIALIIFIFITVVIESFQVNQQIINSNFSYIAKALFYHCVALLPLIFSVCGFLSTIFTYRQLNSGSEIMILKTFGLSYGQISKPTWVLGIFFFLMSFQCSFYFAPWAKGQLTQMGRNLINTQVFLQGNIREGVFLDRFSDLVIYVNKLDKSDGSLKELFIYDERNPKVPLTIVAQRGKFLSDALGPTLALYDGRIYQSGEESGMYSQINFKVNKFIFPQLEKGFRGSKSYRSMLMSELYALNSTNKRIMRKASLEIHKRWALPFSSLIFTLVALNFGMMVYQRESKDPFFVACGVLIFYWLALTIIERFVKNYFYDLTFLLWLPNLVLLIYGIYQLKKLRINLKEAFFRAH